PHRGVGGAPRNVRVLGGTLGAPPWRFFTRGRASVSLSAPAAMQRRALPSDPCSELLAARAEWPAGGGPGLPRPTGSSRRRRTPHLAPPSGSPPETPLDERGWEWL